MQAQDAVPALPSALNHLWPLRTFCAKLLKDINTPVNIIVCMKQILDPETPARDFRLDPVKKEAMRGSTNLVTNIFCENALETALQFREREGGHITVLCFGGEDAEDSLRKALAMKADAAVLVINDGHQHPDPLSVAKTLAAAIRKLGEFDLVLTGRESGDWGAGQSGLLLAEELGLPCVSFADRLDSESEHIRVKRQTDTGWEIFDCKPPIVVTITNDEHNAPRVPKTRDVMMSYRQPLTKWMLDDLSLNADEICEVNSYYEVVELFIPAKDDQCEFMDGASLEAKVEQFAQRIAEVTTTL